MTNLIPANEYCLSVFDGTHDTPKPVSEGKPLITSKHISGGSLDSSSAYLISERDYLLIQKRSAVSQWDILFSMIGSVGEVYLERNATIPYAIKNIGVFSCKSESKARWLYYYLISPAAKTHIQRYLNGAVQKFLPLGALRNFPVPPYDETKKSLVKVLSTIDAKIDCNNRINAELELMTNRLYAYWFVQFDFPDSNGKPYKTSGGKMAYNDVLNREIPEGWSVESLLECCEVVDCLHSKKPDYSFECEKYYLLQLENIIDNGQVDLSNKYFVAENDYKNWTSRIEVREYDIVMTNAGRVAAFAQIPSNVNCGIGRNITAIRPTKIAPNFFYLSLSSMDVQRQILTNLDQGAFFKSFNVKGIKVLNLLRPVNEIELRFENTVTPLIKKRHALLEENHTLFQLRDWLLPLLMNGEVTFS